jgi:hypothetical protein
MKNFIIYTVHQGQVEWSSQKVEVGRACSTKGEKWNEYMLLVGEPEEKRPVGRPRHRRG